MQVLTKRDDIHLNDGMKSRYYVKEGPPYAPRLVMRWPSVLNGRVTPPRAESGLNK
jgi:hypothetical protein